MLVSCYTSLYNTRNKAKGEVMPRAKKMTKTEAKKAFKPIIEAKIAELEEKIKAIAGETFSEEGNGSAFGTHMADVSGDLYEQEFSAGILSKEYELLIACKQAIERIEHGIYGICQGCGNPIPKARLKVIPTALLCIKCEEEQNG